MRQELKKLLNKNAPAEDILNSLKGFNLVSSLNAIKFITQQDCSVEEKIYSIISSIK